MILKKIKQLKNMFDIPRYITHPILQCTIRELGRWSFPQKKLKKIKKIRHIAFYLLDTLGLFVWMAPMVFCYSGPVLGCGNRDTKLLSNLCFIRFPVHCYSLFLFCIFLWACFNWLNNQYTSVLAKCCPNQSL